MSTFNEARFREVCKEITQTCDCKDGYCFYRKLITEKPPEIRVMVQVECMEKFRWEESERQRKDLEGTAYMLWYELGLSQAFAEAYDENLTVKEIYARTLAIQKTENEAARQKAIDKSL